MADEWFIQINSTVLGPLTYERLKLRAQQAGVTPDTPVKNGLAGKWLKAGQVKGLFSTEVGNDEAKTAAPPAKPASPSPRPIQPSTAASSNESKTAAPSSKPASSLPIAKPPAPARAAGTARAQTRGGFWTYCVQNFATTRWLECIGICLGIIAIPFISLLKPVLGFSGLCFVLAGAAGLSVVSGMVYLFWCFIAYSKRSSPNRAWSFMAPLAYGGLMFLVPMVPWIAAEYFTPRHGLLATIFPDFQKDQAKWFGLTPKEPSPAVENKRPSTAEPAKTTPEPTNSGDRKIFIVKYRHSNHKHQETEEVSATSEKGAKEIVLKKHDHIGVMSVTPK